MGHMGTIFKEQQLQILTPYKKIVYYEGMSLWKNLQIKIKFLSTNTKQLKIRLNKFLLYSHHLLWLT